MTAETARGLAEELRDKCCACDAQEMRIDDADVLIEEAFADVRRKALEEAGSADWVTARPPEEAPFGTRVLAWFFMPKNPPASGWAIAERVDTEGHAETHDDLGDFGPGCWWAHDRYYAAEHIKAWLWLPLPWVETAKTAEGQVNVS